MAKRALKVTIDSTHTKADVPSWAKTYTPFLSRQAMASVSSISNAKIYTIENDHEKLQQLIIDVVGSNQLSVSFSHDKRDFVNLTELHNFSAYQAHGVDFSLFIEEVDDENLINPYNSWHTDEVYLTNVAISANGWWIKFNVKGGFSRHDYASMTLLPPSP
jgi:hypothetical protein